MNRYIGLRYILLIVLFGFFCSSFVSAQTIEGLWLNYDPRNNKPLSEVLIYQQNGTYFGKIMKLYQYPPNTPNPICSKCSGRNKDKPWIGLVILDNFRKNGNMFEGGTLLIPKYGVTLPCKLEYNPSQPNQLLVECKVGLMTRGSNWQRIR